MEKQQNYCFRSYGTSFYHVLHYVFNLILKMIGMYVLKLIGFVLVSKEFCGPMIYAVVDCTFLKR